MTEIPDHVKKSDDVATSVVALGHFQLGDVPPEGTASEGSRAELPFGPGQVGLPFLGHLEAVLRTCLVLGRAQIPLR